MRNIRLSLASNALRRKNDTIEIVCLDVRRNRAMLRRQGRMLIRVPANHVVPRTSRLSRKFQRNEELEREEQPSSSKIFEGDVTDEDSRRCRVRSKKAA